jgi:hypothetical protein
MKYITVHPVGYINLPEVVKHHGADLCKVLREQLSQAKTGGAAGQCTTDAFESQIADSIAEKTLSLAQADFLRLILDQLILAGATGDIIWSS